ncbi:hypothetical protein ACIBF1_18755 [Spirillospora sp. NPDC050679]
MTVDIRRAEGAFLFILGVLLNQGMPARRAWQIPERLAGRLGGDEPWRFADAEQVESAMCASPALHRFPRAMARNVTGAAGLVLDRWDGDPRGIWAPGRDADAVLADLCAFSGIGRHKALVGLFLLTREHGARITLGGKPVHHYAHGCRGLEPAIPLLEDAL